MYRDCAAWVKTCTECSMKLNPRPWPTARLTPIPLESAFSRVAIDCLGPFPICHSGNRYILVITDYLTRWPEAFALPTIDAPTIARVFLDEIVARHGCPRILLSDRGSNFLSHLVREVCRLLDCKKVQTSSYHPACNGLVERFNSVLSKSLSMYVSKNQKDWDVFIPSVLSVIVLHQLQLRVNHLFTFYTVENRVYR